MSADQRVVNPMDAQRVRTASTVDWCSLDFEGRLTLFTFAHGGGDAPAVRAHCPAIDRAALHEWYTGEWRKVYSVRRGP
jgi:hypothetical protein